MKAAIRHGALYLADLNPRRGTGVGKLRPVLVIQTDLLNQADPPNARLSGRTSTTPVVRRGCNSG